MLFSEIMIFNDLGDGRNRCPWAYQLGLYISPCQACYAQKQSATCRDYIFDTIEQSAEIWLFSTTLQITIFLQRRGWGLMEFFNWHAHICVHSHLVLKMQLYWKSEKAWEDTSENALCPSETPRTSMHLWCVCVPVCDACVYMPLSIEGKRLHFKQQGKAKCLS